MLLNAKDGDGSDRSGGRNAINRTTMIAVPVLYAFVIVITIVLTIQNNNNLENILEENVKSELVAACFSARTIIDDDIPLFLAVDGDEYIEAHYERWSNINDRLRDLKDSIGAQYIYALRKLGNSPDSAYHFVFDTDEETDEIFTEYELDPVHLEALEGNDAAGLLNSTDEWGSYNTGAVPIYDNHRIVGIVGVDYADHYISQSKDAAFVSEIVLFAVLILSLGILIVILVVMANKSRRMQAELYRLANIDAVTGLPNRHFLYSEFAQRSKQLMADKTLFAVVFIDLDNFKLVNDSAGHETGDTLLRLIAGFLQQTATNLGEKAARRSVTARIGGDEFLQVLVGVENERQANEYAQNLFRDFAKTLGLIPYIHNYHLGLSVGIALFPQHSENYNQLIRNADVAMYASKQQGKNSFRIYDPSMDSLVTNVQLSIRKVDTTDKKTAQEKSTANDNLGQTGSTQPIGGTGLD
jgi:diguanylate cyclase (GGDEF)-like protein